MVDLRDVVPNVVLDVRYARADNFTGAPLPGYDVESAWLTRPAAEALSGVAESLAAQGYGLLIHDAYRPQRATTAMVAWAESTGQTWVLDRGYVARRSGHARGHTVDLALYELATGTPVDFGSPYDEFSKVSHLRGVDGEPLQRRIALRDAMVAGGFEPYAKEWWHFSLPSAGRPASDVPYACE